MKIKKFFVCSRCTYRGKRGKCINCRVPLEKMCMVCNNAENNCYFVNCNRIKGLIKKRAKTRKRKTKQIKTKKNTKRSGKKRRK